MTTFLLIIILVLILFLVWQNFTRPAPEIHTLPMLLNQMQKIAYELGAMEKLGQEIKNFKDDFTTFFNSPKLRGNLGEAILKDLIVQVLPKEQYAFQHHFREGQIVDAVIITDKGLIPIDAKFPLENYRKHYKENKTTEKDNYYRQFIRDVKKHITDISQKYILPQEQTLDFALMYLPSESIYYEVMVNNTELQQFALNHNILPVSPNNLYYFLKVILLGLEGKKIEQQAKSILELLKAVQKNTQNLGQELQILSRHVTNAKNSMDHVSNEYHHLDERISRIKLLK